MPLTLVVISLVVYAVILVAQPAFGIVNNKRNSTVQYSPHFYPRKEYIKKKSYLEGSRPLWVLEDKVARPGEIDVATHRPFKVRKKFISPSRYIPKLPSHYANLSPPVVHVPSRYTLPKNYKQHSNKRTSFPVFDDFEMDSDPILIYRGPKAEMIFNTMMTSRRYPMQEPVPGQVMYPPYSPKFKPTPVVERSRSPDNAHIFHNLTLIPFYAHEAIGAKELQYEAKSTEAVQSSVENSIAASSDKPTCYHSYYSQDDVQAKYWPLTFTTPPPLEPATEMSLNHQLVAPDAFYPNHRMETTTQNSHSPSVDTFRIFYDDDSEAQKQPPKPRYKTVHSAKYGGFKTLYPIYTLNKLLKYNPHKQFPKPTSNTSQRKRRLSPPSEETWLLYNSRRKPAHTSNYLDPNKLHQQTSIDLNRQISIQ